MKKYAEAVGKTVEEARKAAVLALELDIDENDENLTFTILEEPKKGFLGIGASPAKVGAEYVITGYVMALDFIRKLITDMQLDLTATLSDCEDGGKVINIEGEGAGVLIGHHGETLDSIQYLASLAANKKVDGEKREFTKITVDVEGYRSKREETLRTLARRMAEKVRKYKKSVVLEPMNPYERRIIHFEVQNIEGVATNSIGSENNRKVVIYLKSKDSDNKRGFANVPGFGSYSDDDKELDIDTED